MSHKPTNFCRELRQWAVSGLRVPSSTPEAKAGLQAALGLAASARKFMMAPPANYAAVLAAVSRRTDAGQRIRLPYPSVAVEVVPTWAGLDRLIVFLTELEAGEAISMLAVVRRRADSTWHFIGGQELPAINGLSGLASALHDRGAQELLQWSAEPAQVAIYFLAVLSCCNVVTMTVPRSGPARRVGMALPYDEYHVLAVDVREDPEDYERDDYSPVGGAGGARRAPRQHERRGHERHLRNGKVVWVQVCTVAKGSKGRITKDYLLVAS